MKLFSSHIFCRKNQITIWRKIWFKKKNGSSERSQDLFSKFGRTAEKCANLSFAQFCAGALLQFSLVKTVHCTLRAKYTLHNNITQHTAYCKLYTAHNRNTNGALCTVLQTTHCTIHTPVSCWICNDPIFSTICIRSQTSELKQFQKQLFF